MYQYKAQLIKVVDGDTIEVDFDLGFGVWLRNQRIRLYGIDTPESRTSDKEEKARGLISKAKLNEVLSNSKYLTVETEIDPEEKYGRILGRIETDDGVNVNDWMVEKCYAVPYNGENKDKVQELHKANAKKLKERGEISL
jgi:micrococcal nuclease